MPTRRGGLSAAVLDERIYVFGGETSTSVFDDTERYDPASNGWSALAALPTARHGLAAAALHGRIYVIGGGPRAGLAQTAIVEVFIP
jgi:N-acetylneuraminic acid mutarotase